MKRKILLPFALSTIAVLLNGCGGEKTNIKEDPNTGVTGVTQSTSCDVSASDCLPFVVDYPIAGLNFDCSTDKVNHFSTKIDGNIASGACKLGDDVTFYIQGESPRKINLGTIKLDDISKLKMATPPRIRLIDLATALTGTPAASIDINDETIHVALALINIFQGLSIEREDNILGDIQPTTLTKDKKDKLAIISKDVGAQEFKNGEYINILKPWLKVDNLSDNQALDLLKQLLNLSNTGVWQADLPVAKPSGTVETSRPDGFFGCNKDTYALCTKADQSNLLHSMGNFLLLSDRQGYILGYGQQFKGPATIVNGLVLAPYILSTKVKPVKMQLNAQTGWLNSIERTINSSQPLRFSLNSSSTNDLLITKGKIVNGNTIAGTESIYRQLTKMKDTDPVDSKYLGAWQQSIANENYKGVLDIVKVNPVSYLTKDIFRTEKNVKSKESYVFPLYATLTFRFKETSIPAVDVGIVIDENGDIRTDIKNNSTSTDLSGVCGTVKTINADGTITDSNDQVQYRIGTTGGTLFSADDKSITVRMILSNPKFGNVDGAMFGLNLSTGTGAKINIHNLLAGQPTGINLSNFTNDSVTWSNTYAGYQLIYNELYDKLKDTERNDYIAPTTEDRELAKRYSGTVSIKIADQKIDACKAIRIKP
ncbi:hypothetical protein MMO39_09995 [Acinetobacter modestus]|uniref:putative pilus system protein FilF n=1 Tax=Acinetobacter modestus TaxID=1776740 RepID=UPI001F4B42F1|nr:hypothetical protein [Acinetobacter modestus]MCH7387630.1 hypothetical protein [Acinetobacter modestus]